MRAMAIAMLGAATLASVAYAGVIHWTRTAGVECAFGTGPQGTGVACTRSDGTGYAITLTRDKVIVWNPDRTKAFQHTNP